MTNNTTNTNNTNNNVNNGIREIREYLNLTSHNINILDDAENVIAIIPNRWLVRLTLKLDLVSNAEWLKIMKRRVEGVEIEVDGNKVDIKELEQIAKDYKWIIVAAQAVPYLKSMLPHNTILTVGETIREITDDGKSIIKGAKYLVAN